MGPWRPSSVPETCRPSRKKKKRASEKPAFEFVPGGRGAQNAAEAALSLAPRLGGWPALELHPWTRRHLLWSRWAGAAAGPGPVRGAGTLLTGCGALTPSQRPTRRQRRQQGRQRGSRLPGSSAPSRGGGERCCCGWRRPPPLSPYRTRGPELSLALRPGG